MQRSHKDFSVSALRRNYTSPHVIYRSLRSFDSIYFDESSQCWLVTGHAPIIFMLDDVRFSSGLGAATSTQMASVRKQMLFFDGAEHQRAQAVMLRPLAQMVKRMPEHIKTYIQPILQKAQQKGEMDTVSEFASTISLLTIAQVLGMPMDLDELHQLERWSDTFGDITSGYFRGNRQDVINLENYFRRLIASKRQNLADDLLSAFIAGEECFPEEDDLVANCMMVFSAGRITTKKLLGNGLLLLAQRWDEVHAAYQASPQTIPKLLGEELLRVVTPTRCIIREALEDVDLTDHFPGNHLIRRGQRVLLFLEAANYDTACFEHPDVFQIERRPNKHIAFGYGPHQCPGATLARVEIQTSLAQLLANATLELKPGAQPVWNPNPNLGGFDSCVLAYKPSSRALDGGMFHGN